MSSAPSKCCYPTISTISTIFSPTAFFAFFTAENDDLSVADLILQVYEGAHE